MAETTTQCVTHAKGTRIPGRGATINIPCLSGPASRLRNAIGLPASSPVTQNGSFEFDRVVKSGYVHKSTRKTKAWKHVFLVLWPNSLFIYKSDSESKLRHKPHTKAAYPDAPQPILVACLRVPGSNTDVLRLRDARCPPGADGDR
ncbi:Uu.00g123370.m01.CDS01 [Anthostomella pinea]|uniref:Uu.00g123370.m01.CDS01 n=1 Tax=Anthostomella pinea TaxID=933095 RepID=A0AAI8VHB6_9PEZI|nr:Uu.00g123370.m01.CDS01 [Anthostomella pinea]